jgi:predicted transcriptional regulator
VNKEGGDWEGTDTEAPSLLSYTSRYVSLFISTGRRYYLFIYYESTKRKVKTKYICECRCYERLQTKTKEFTRLSYLQLVLELEHLKIETRLITEMFTNVMGECENVEQLLSFFMC